MRLTNLCFPGRPGAVDLLITKDRIESVTAAAASEVTAAAAAPAETESGDTPTLSFDGALVFPGLINSHDHLEFNLFPMLGNRIYQSYTQWGPDIHANNNGIIKQVLQVPQALRTLWGIYKNLLNGFTTVVNHGERLHIDNPLINVFQESRCLHSVGFEQRWQWKLNRPRLSRQPFALHVGEGTDEAAGAEIDRLIRWNLFKRPLIGIHGVAMTERQAKAFRALVWCPASNYFLLDRTAPIDKLKSNVPILFGTDSTLTAGWNSWTQIRMGRQLGLMTDRELLDTLTTAPAKAWDLPDRGVLAPGKIADIVIARPKGDSRSMDAFFDLNPEDLLLVLHEGHIRLFDASLLDTLQTQRLLTGEYHEAVPGGKYVSGDLPGLMRDICRYYPAISTPSFL